MVLARLVRDCSADSCSHYKAKPMSKKSFAVRTKLRESLEKRGTWNDYVRTHMQINEMDPDRHCSVLDDEENHRTIIAQETADAQEEEPQDNPG